MTYVFDAGKNQRTVSIRNKKAKANLLTLDCGDLPFARTAPIARSRRGQENKWHFASADILKGTETAACLTLSDVHIRARRSHVLVYRPASYILRHKSLASKPGLLMGRHGRGGSRLKLDRRFFWETRLPITFLMKYEIVLSSYFYSRLGIHSSQPSI